MTLMLYLTSVIATRVLAATLVLLLLGLSLDLLKSATDLLDEGGIRALGTYALLRAPLITATLFPIAVLAGGVLAFLALSRRSEMVVIRAMGQSIFGTLRLMIPAAMLLGLIYHLLDDRVAPWGEARLLQSFPVSAEAAGIGAEIWYRTSDEVVFARLAATDGSALEDLTFWPFDAEGQVSSKTSAARADHEDGVWLVTGYEEDATPTPWQTLLTPASVRALASGSLAVSTATAKQALSGTGVSTRGDAYYSTLIAHSYVTPLIPAVMLVIAAVASFGLVRGSGGVGYAIVAIVAGFVYVVTDGVLGTLSEVGAINPILAATLPSALFITLGIWSLIVLEET